MLVSNSGLGFILCAVCQTAVGVGFHMGMGPMGIPNMFPKWVTWVQVWYWMLAHHGTPYLYCSVMGIHGLISNGKSFYILSLLLFLKYFISLLKVLTKKDQSLKLQQTRQVIERVTELVGSQVSKITPSYHTISLSSPYPHRTPPPPLNTSIQPKTEPLQPASNFGSPTPLSHWMSAI